MEKQFVLLIQRIEKKSQMFVSTAICPADIIKSFRSSQPTCTQIRYCAKVLRDECKSFEFNLL